MTLPVNIKPTHKAIKAYREALDAYAGQQVTHEGATETAFQRLLDETARSHGWMLVPKLPIKRGGKSITPDGTIRDDFNLHRGYPLTKTIFEDTTRVRPCIAVERPGDIA